MVPEIHQQFWEAMPDGGFFTDAVAAIGHQRMFRDWLRIHPDDLARYQAVKLAAAGGEGSEYLINKRPVVLDIVNSARAARGLASIDELDPDD
jgi:hypothetical protein